MKRNIYLVILGFIFITILHSCKEEALPPSSFEYITPVFGTIIYSESATTPPTINWGGETGTFALVGLPLGIGIDAKTGSVNWVKSLPLGVNKVDVLAKNSAGETTASVTINNILSGNFLGGYNTDPATTTLTETGFSMKFSSDGSFTSRDINNFLSSDGMWTLGAGNTVTGTFTFPGTQALYAFEGIVTYTSTQTPYIAGYMKPAADVSWTNYFKIDL